MRTSAQFDFCLACGAVFEDDFSISLFLPSQQDTALSFLAWTGSLALYAIPRQDKEFVRPVD